MARRTGKSRGVRGVGAWLAAGLVAAGASQVTTGCTSRNALGRTQVALLPEALLASQSAAAYQEQRTTKKIVATGKQAELVKRVADRLVAEAKRHYAEYQKGFAWEATLFEDDATVNAYCMPGGKIGFYTGILPVCATEAGVAAVMGHEIAHALLSHGNERVTAQLGVAAVTALSELALDKSGKLDPTTRTALLAAVGLGAEVGVVLPNSRVNENEADRLGLSLMARAGYDPAEGPRVWERMKAASGGGGGPEWLSTHPDEDRRIRRLTEFQVEAGPLYQAATTRYGVGESL